MIWVHHSIKQNLTGVTKTGTPEIVIEISTSEIISYQSDYDALMQNDAKMQNVHMSLSFFSWLIV